MVTRLRCSASGSRAGVWRSGAAAPPLRPMPSTAPGIAQAHCRRVPTRGVPGAAKAIAPHVAADHSRRSRLPSRQPGKTTRHVRIRTPHDRIRQRLVQRAASLCGTPASRTPATVGPRRVLDAQQQVLNAWPGRPLRLPGAVDIPIEAVAEPGPNARRIEGVPRLVPARTHACIRARIAGADVRSRRPGLHTMPQRRLPLIISNRFSAHTGP